MQKDYDYGDPLSIQEQTLRVSNLIIITIQIIYEIYFLKGLLNLSRVQPSQCISSVIKVVICHNVKA